MTDKEILDFKVGDMTIAEMTALTFFGWVSKKLNGLNAHSGQVGELRMAVMAPPRTPKLSDVSKIHYVRKMLALNITL